MKYTIAQLSQKSTQAGKPFFRASLKDESGQIIDNVSIWPDYPSFEDLKTGDEIGGSVETNTKGFRYLKTSNRPPQNGSATKSEGQRNMQMVTSREDYRSEIIRQAQDRKNESIAYFNAVNAAISLVSSLQPKLMNNVNRPILKQEIDYWREWFLDEWKKHDINTRYRVRPA